MDLEEDKTEENNRTSQSSSTQSFYPRHTQRSPKRSRTSSHDDSDHAAERRFSGSVPLDLAWDILTKLPAKSIVRSRSVCKHWSSITTSPDFVNQFPSLYSASRPCVLLIFVKGETRFVFSFPQHQNPVDPYSQVERYEEVINPNHRKLGCCSDSVHGLICFKNKKTKQLVIWNPTMRKFLTLPKHGNSLGQVRGLLGYDPIECKYKVLSFLTESEIWVLTLGAQESWRIVEASPMHRLIPTTSDAVCIKGTLYYKVSLASALNHAIMSFDLRFETFSLIEFPVDDNSQDLMVTYEGRLALVRSMAYGVKIWILEDGENQKWSYTDFLYHPSDNKWMSLDLKGVTDAGELVYTPSILYESFRVVYVDPKRKRVRETTFEGIANKEFRRLRGLGFRQFDNLIVFPNHIENLFSL